MLQLFFLLMRIDVKFYGILTIYTSKFGAQAKPKIFY
jgi:hypothetical protein